MGSCKNAASRCLRPAELRGRGPVGDRELIEPAAVRIAGRPVEAGDIRLEIEDGRSVDDIDAREQHGLAGYAQQPDEAEPDRVDPARSAGGEDAHQALLAPQQELNLPERRIGGRLARPAAPGETASG